MGISRQVLKHRLGAGEGLFNIDDPLRVSSGIEIGSKPVFIHQRFKGSVELKLRMKRHHLLQKQSPEQSGQDPDR